MKRLLPIRLRGVNLKPRDLRALKLGALILGPTLLFSHGVQPYLRARAELQEQLQAEREHYGRELKLVTDSERFPELRRQTEKGLEREVARLFEGPNDASAAAALAALVETRAKESAVHLEGVEALAVDSAASGLLRLRVQVQGLSDLEGVLRFLAALEGGDKLVSVEELRIERREGFSVSPPAATGAPPATGSAVATAIPGAADPAETGPVQEAASVPTVLSLSAVVVGYTEAATPSDETGDRSLAVRDR